MPIAGWADTVLSDKTADVLLANSARIKAEVANVAREVGGKMPQLVSEEDIKSHYFGFFIALVDTMVTVEKQELFMQQYASLLRSTPQAIDRESLFTRLRSFLESPIPDNFELKTKATFRAENIKTNRARTRQRVKELFCGLQSKL